ncbi:ABC transporter substrate-binding protein [Lapillicoccus jejuensis]|uniref:Peptide/nickel transport system substrate-binding protein n=1 Tax=Lapillicoccus jejuensis TaxID=402171 RepID=A0A542DWC2_9MICO|nr:ABC transporter substrate-binding protein [Lapillicoccus jejuensis]TQJ07388.1 peptide/nickel transport system substrate-binding protein [Lapillicoccus jejuensis]
MPRRPTRVALVVPLLLAALVAAACSAPSRKPSAAVAAANRDRGGALEVLLDQDVRHWDPQRIDGGPEAALAVRMFVRTLTTTNGGAPGVDGSPVQADLATTTGTATDGGRTWTFTLRTDVEWQDERTVTCEDVRYGVSRAFATDVLTGAPAYAASLLDIPSTTDAQGRTVSAYAGPYRGTGQALYDRAVTCSGRTITFHLKRPAYDFDQTVALPAFAPVRRDHDLRGAMNLMVFSCGPYMLEGEYVPGVGGRFVRTRTWTPLSDFVRRALPDSVTLHEGLDTTTAVQRLVDDQGPDRFGVTVADTPPALQARLLDDPALAGRTTSVPTPTVDVLVPDTRSPVMRSAAARRALAVATDRTAFVAASGGPTALDAATSLLPSTVAGTSTTDPYGAPAAGDPTAARALLAGSGLTLPVPIRVAYRSSALADAGFAALRAGWQRAGFAVTLVPLAEGATAPAGVDVSEQAWTAAWPSASTLLPVFVARTPGWSTDPTVTRLLAAAETTEAATARGQAWAALDRALATSGAYVALAQPTRVLVHGSGVVGYADSADLGGYPDLARLQLARP